jgi:hypothetical protein
LRGGGSSDLAQGDVPSGLEATLRVSVTYAIRGAVVKANKQQ